MRTSTNREVEGGETAEVVALQRYNQLGNRGTVFEENICIFLYVHAQLKQLHLP